MKNLFVWALLLLLGVCGAALSDVESTDKEGARTLEEAEKEVKETKEARERRLCGCSGCCTTPEPTRSPTRSPTDRPPNDIDVDLTGCFSGLVTVDVKDKGVVAMKDLQVGDQIATGKGSYSPVYAFGHYAPYKSWRFLQIHTSLAPAAAKSMSPPVLEMTKDHLVFLQHKPNPVRADSLRVGDVLQATSQDAAVLGATITKIVSVRRTGLYAPMTEEGTLLANGIVASSYVSLQDDQDEYVTWTASEGKSFLGMSQHDYVHMGLSPYRILCRGVSSHFGSLDKIRSSDDDYDGMTAYPAFAVFLNRWLHQQHWLVELFVLCLVLVLTGSLLVVENMVGAAWTPTFLVMTAVAGWFWIYGNIRFRAVKLKSA